MSLLGFGVKNLRCLTDTGIVPIKPITLLVGRNSSGKSTFLRAFPLLRQSVEAPRESPILWYDPAFVDFGSFADAVNYRSDDTGITFRFRLRGEDTVSDPLLRWKMEDGAIFDVAMTVSQGPEGPYVASYEILVEDHVVDMRFEPNGKLIRYEVDSYDVLPEDVPLSLGGRVVLLPTLQLADSARTAYIPAARKPRHDLAEYEYEGDIDVLWSSANSGIYGRSGKGSQAGSRPGNHSDRIGRVHARDGQAKAGPPRSEHRSKSRYALFS